MNEFNLKFSVKAQWMEHCAFFSYFILKPFGGFLWGDYSGFQREKLSRRLKFLPLEPSSKPYGSETTAILGQVFPKFALLGEFPLWEN
jgi:hypothetical protein